MQSERELDKDNSANFLVKKNINEAQFQESFFRTWEYTNKL